MKREIPSKTALSKSVLVYVIAAVMLLNPLSALQLSAQTTFRVRGIVKDAGGKAVPGVTVTEKGTSKKTSTNAKGRYRINIANDNATLIFSYKNDWREEVAVKANGRVVRNVQNRTVYRLDRTLRCSSGTVWLSGSCVIMATAVITAGPVYITSGDCPTGKSWGQHTRVGQNGCLPKVEFHSQNSLSLGAAQTLAVKNGWVMATGDEVSKAWKELKLDTFAYGMLNDGRFAVPVQKDHPPTFKRGANIGVNGANQGFFYVVKAAVARAQTAPAPKPPRKSNQLIVSNPGGVTSYRGGNQIPDSVLKNPSFAHLRFKFLCNSNPGNPMLDGWNNSDRPLFDEAARLYFAKKRTRINRQTLSSNPVKRWEFAPFMLRAMWNALITQRPTSAQATFRKKFETWAACDETKVAKATLALWNNHIGKSNSISGKHWFGSVPAYKPNTLGVLIDTKGKGNIEGFLPLDNPLFIGTKGKTALTLLYKPMMAKSLPNFDDTENIRSLGGDMSETAVAAGITTVGIGLVGAMAGGGIINHHIKSARFTIEANKGIKARDLEKLQKGVQEIAKQNVDDAVKKFGPKVVQKAAKKTGESAGKAAAKNLAKKIWGVTLKQSLDAAAKKAGQKAGELAARKVAIETAKHIATKVVAAAAVIGIIATFGEILGTTVANAIKTSQYDASINKAARDVKDFSVTKFLGRRPGQFQKSTVFTQLVKMTIADPTDLGLLTMALPPVKCETGTKVTNTGECIREVKFHSQASLSLGQATQIAFKKNWNLATEDEVAYAWYSLGLDVFAFGRMAKGRFAVPVTRDHSNFKIGPNLGARGGNQGFFYTVGKPSVPINPVGRGLVRFQNNWYKDQYVHIQNNQKPEVGRIQRNWASAIWKLVPVGDGWVRIQSTWFKDRYLSYDAPKNKLEFRRIQPNWHSAQWKLVPAGGGWVRIQNRWYPKRFLYFDAPNNKLVVGPIKPNWASARWRVK